MQQTGKRSALIEELPGTLAAAAIVLPQAMAFGISLFVLLQQPAAIGALAGVIGACLLNLCAGLSRGTVGLLSSPTGPATVLLSGVILSLTAEQLPAEMLLPAFLIMGLLSGIIVFLLAIGGGGRLVQLIPYPVVAGFMTGSGLLMAWTQLRHVASSDSMLPLVIAAMTALLVELAPRLLPKIPGTLSALILGIALYFTALFLFDLAPESNWTVGTLPTPSASRFHFSFELFSTLPWLLLLSGAAALALLLSINTLLVAMVADAGTGARHSARCTLYGLGSGQILTALCGGIGGSGTTGATMVAVASGARARAPLLLALLLALLLFAGREAGQFLPLCVLAGLLLHVSWKMLEHDMMAWLRVRATRLDGIVALAVTAITLVYDLMTAVGAGVAIAVVFFVRAQMQAPVIHRRSTARERHSLHVRTHDERALLDQQGDRIVLYELRGALFFAKADRLFDAMSDDLERRCQIILDLRRVEQVDLTGLHLLQQITDRLRSRGGDLLFCDLRAQTGIGRRMNEALARVRPQRNGSSAILTFNSADEALEYAETALLRETGQLVNQQALTSLAQTDLCADMNEAQIRQLEQVSNTLVLGENDYAFRQNDSGDALYIVMRGQIDVRLPVTQHHYLRLMQYGAGMTFGEVAFFNTGSRTADAVALTTCELRMLNRGAFDQLARTAPDTAIAVLMALNRTQSEHLRWSAQELRRLAAW